MSCLGWSNNRAATVVADASVVINLLATGRAGIILSALPSAIVLVEQVAAELDSGRRKGRKQTHGHRALISGGYAEVVRLGHVGLGHFSKLVSGSAATTLDDGEAATIAYAAEHGIPILIDERKATRVCMERFGELPIACTVDLFAHSAVRRALGQAGLSDALFNALYDGRMRVPPRYREWVINIVGEERARLCTSLPSSVRGRLNASGRCLKNGLRSVE